MKQFQRRQIATLAAVAALFLAGGVAAQNLAPRQPLPKMPVKAIALPPQTPGAFLEGPQYRLVVKFRDQVRARSANGALISRSAAGVRSAEELARTFGMIFSPLIDLPEHRLAQLEERAARRSLVAQPDLAGILKVDLPGASPADLEAAGEALQALPEVEFAYIQTLGVPPPHDHPPMTPDYTPLQTYFGPDPGMDVDYAWSLGFKGAGIRLSDCEYGWNYLHEDLHDKNLHPEPGQTIHPDVPQSFYEHGTAVLGETSAGVNGFGVNGMVPDADVYTFPEYTVEAMGARRVEAIAAAIAGSDVGDVVLLEMQTSLGAPAEVDPAVWIVVESGTDAGVVVVAAAGNGDQDLDGPAFKEYRSRGDSGAIIVGAGSSDVNHDKLSFSTHGSRVDVQGWGENVFTLGYGHFAEHGGDINQRYTDRFGGTSAAAPFAAAAAVALQEAAVSPVSSRNLRALLIDTGIPQGTGEPIGPFIDLRAALDELLANDPPTPKDDYFGTLWETPIDLPYATLLGNDSDPDPGDVLTVCGFQAPQHGTLEESPGFATYTPPAGCKIDRDSFTYAVCDDLDGVAEGTVWIEIGGIVCPSSE